MSITKAKNAAKAALVTAALGIAAGSVQAKDAPYVFMAIDTTRHGADVVHGRYDDAIMRIRGKSDTEPDFSESTNLCIAYTKTGDAANGIANCNRAVDIARRKNGVRRIGGAYAMFASHGKDLDLVIALSNRSVAHATNGDYAMALKDLQEADALRPHLRVVPRNLEALAESMNAAQ